MVPGAGDQDIKGEVEVGGVHGPGTRGPRGGVGEAGRGS